MSHDRWSQYDAAYVLGALSPSDRQDFEGHLRDCGGCRRAVAEVAGLPGLLARVDPEDLERGEPPRAEAGEAGAGPVPETLLPRLLREVARSGRRRRTRAVALSAAAAAAVAAVSGGVTAVVRDGAGSQPPARVAVAAPARPMAQLGQSQLSARVAMEQVAWGTRLSITCTYAADPYGSGALPRYALVVHTRDGAEQVATWRAVAGRPTTVTAATASPPSEITSVEVRTTDGKPVLRLAG